MEIHIEFTRVMLGWAFVLIPILMLFLVWIWVDSAEGKFWKNTYMLLAGLTIIAIMGGVGMGTIMLVATGLHMINSHIFSFCPLCDILEISR